MKEIRIKIEGNTNTGKSFLKYKIEKFLKDEGFENIYVEPELFESETFIKTERNNKLQNFYNVETYLKKDLIIGLHEDIIAKPLFSIPKELSRKLKLRQV